MAGREAALPREVSVGSVAVLAVLFLLAHLTHISAEEGTMAIILGVAFPVLFTVLLGVASHVLWKSPLTDTDVLIVAGYTVLGAVFAGLVEGVAILYRHLELQDPGFLLNLGHERYVLLTFATIGALAGWLVGWNYAHRRMEHRRVAEANAELREQTEQLEELTSILSHDIRNPLNVATGRLELLVEETDSTHCHAIERALERIDAIITETLMLARQDRTLGERTSVDLEAQAREAWMMVETDDVDLEVASTAAIEADPNRLRQAFENLFRNAIDHGGDNLETVRVAVEDDLIAVADDGVGLSTGNSADIFEMGMTTEPTGTGLGLSVVEKVVSAHGWAIRATESESGGARFEIDLDPP